MQKRPASACLAWTECIGIDPSMWQCPGGSQNWVVTVSPSTKLFTTGEFQLYKGAVDVDCSSRKKTQLVLKPQCMDFTF